MKVNKLELNNFRNYKKKTFEFGDNLTVIVGPNGSGKTNILEAIYLLSLGKSPRVSLEQELVNTSSEVARVVGHFDNKIKLELAIQKREGTKRIKKLFKANGVTKNSANFVGIAKTVLFAPEDIRLVAGSPSRRREYLDRFLAQTHEGYYKTLLKYERVLKQRNKLLESLQGQFINNIHQNQLSFWTEQLVETGEAIQKTRDLFFEYAQKHLPEVSRKLYTKGYGLKLRYIKNQISKERIEDIKDLEISKGLTLVGPHRDDFEFILENDNTHNLKGYGSRGEQRTGVFCVKALEIKYIKELTKVDPILLLDDIFSELDVNYREAVINITLDQQTIITTADINMVPENIKKRVKILSL